MGGSYMPWQLVGNLRGQPGANGSDGKDAYQLAAARGFEGDVDAFLGSLRGKDGTNGADGKDGRDGVNGKDGLSAFDIFKSVFNFDGDERAWLTTLKGDPGESIKGDPGPPPEIDYKRVTQEAATVVGKAFAEALPQLVEQAQVAAREHVEAIKPELKGEKGDSIKGDTGETPTVDYDRVIAAANEVVTKSFADTLPSLVEQARAASREHVESIKSELRGEPGPRGLSTFEIAKQDGGFTGSVLDWIAAQKGVPGENGRDATQYVPILNIDEGRSYPRGTHARVRGSYAMSVKQTMPLEGRSLADAGWEVIVDAPVPELEFDLDIDTRQFTARAKYISGHVAEKSWTIPFPLYRGSWDRDRKYKMADNVTYSGQVFILAADEVPAGQFPAENTEWRLAVRKGRDLGPSEVGKPKAEPVRLK